MSYDEPTYRRRDSGGTDPVSTGSRSDTRYNGDDTRYNSGDDARYSGDDARYSGGQHSAYGGGDARHAGNPDAGAGADAQGRSAGHQAGRFVSGSAEPEPEQTETARHRSVSPAVLGDVFDDPAHGEPGNDRLAVHLGWELLLLLAVAGMGFLLYRDYPAAIRAAELDGLLVSATALGLLALAAGMTMRTAAPNLAVGPVAVASALHFAENGDQGVVSAMLPATVVAAVAGLVLALVVVGLHVPGWAASLAAGLGAIVFIELRTAPVTVQGGYDPTLHAIYLFGGFAALAFLGGLLGTIKTMRRSVGRYRPTGDPAHRRGGVAGAITATAIVISMIFSTLAGLLLAAGGSGSVEPSTGLQWTGLAFGAALLGGTSAFGRRGGIFGTLFAVVALTLFLRYDDERGLDIALAAVAAVTVAAGLVVTRLVERYGRPRSSTVVEQEWEEEPPPPQPRWNQPAPDRRENWSDLPGQSVESRPDSWTTDRWSNR